MSAILEVKNVVKNYGHNGHTSEILHDINLEVETGEFVAIVGFSGTGKTTLINLLGGLEKPTSGTILCKGKSVTAPDPERGIIFQNYSLMPWLTVRGNVAVAVNETRKDLSAAERKAIVEKYVEMVNLSHAIDKRPGELSGGMRQRVSVARALSMNPEILLMDEPLSALDALTRSVLQDQILDIWTQEKKTVILITNDVDEGILMADRIIPLNIGPKASLGPSFIVDIERPRNRKTMNHDPAFKRIRNEVSHYLYEQRRVHKEDADQNAKPATELPRILPAHALREQSEHFAYETSERSYYGI
ncbi:MAG TPA: ABC transporter ATP-binding protein [Pontiella sp.]